MTSDLRVSESVDRGWGLRMCLSNEFPGDIDAADGGNHTLGTPGVAAVCEGGRQKERKWRVCVCVVGRKEEGSWGGICLISQSPRKIMFLQKAWPVIVLGPGVL